MKSNLSSVLLLLSLFVASELVLAAEPLTLSVITDSEERLEIDPLYLSIRLTNGTQTDQTLAEFFWTDYGDVELYWRESDRVFWNQFVLSEAAGRINAIQNGLRTIRPSEHFETIECVIPLSFVDVAEKQPIDLQGRFLRKAGRLDSLPTRLVISPVRRSGRAEMLAVTKLVKQGASKDLTEEELAAANVAAEESDAVARVLQLCEEFRSLRSFDQADDQPVRVDAFARKLKKLPTLERQFWACQFAGVHYRMAARLLDRADADPNETEFHLDFCAALDKSLGTATRNAQSIRYSCGIYRKRLEEYKKSAADGSEDEQ